MHITRRSALALLGAGLVSRRAAARGTYDPGASDSTIKLGNTMPYSGPASAYGAIGRAEAAYFRMLNEQGGINGRKIEFISLDDGYSPPKTVEQTRRLVEQDEVLLDFSSLGTAPNIAIQKYLNQRKIPQLFPSTGASRWNDPAHYPWTTGSAPTYEMEGRIYAKYILTAKPDARIAVITPNEDAGRDYLRGFKAGLGEHVRQIVAEATYETTDPTIDSQIIAFQQSGADFFFNECTPKFAAQAIRRAAAIGWKPQIILPAVSNSVGAVLRPAGIDSALGIVTGTFMKDPGDTRWANDKAMQDWRAFMAKYNPEADVSDVLNVQGYILAQLLAVVLRRAGDDLTRANIMKQATSLDNVALPMLLPGIVANTSPDNVIPIRQLQMARFDGKSWVLFGEVLSG